MTSLHIDTTLFILLYMSMAFDWIYQTAEEGLGKFDNWRIRARHAFKYSALTYVLISLFGYCTWWGLCIWLTLFGTHFMIDDRKAVKWLMKKVKMIGDREMDSLW
ncbi:MAG TPA: hypothetical protein DEG42_06210 [Acholeplasmataceae bacterium]|nr:hypothetical protein [Acholeplasmataceae bacterium]